MKKILLALSCMATLSFANAQNAIPNPGFETWNSNPNYDDPANWGTINGLTWFLGVRTVTKATLPADIHGGSFAIKLESKAVIGQGTAPGIAATGTINTGGYVDGGVAYNKRPVSLTGWYKYTPGGTDTCSVEATLSKWVGNARVEVGKAVFTRNLTQAAYTQFTVNFTYTSANFPDTLVMILLTSSQGSNSPVGSKLWVDDLDFVLCNNFSATGSASATATCTAANGGATVTSANGAGGNVYNWSNSATTSAITAAAGNYNVTVTDGNGCSATSAATIIANSLDITSTISPTTTNCGASTGTATVTPTNGTANYTYNWNTGGNTASISSLGAGSYQVTITDANGCSGTATANVTTPNGPSATQVTNNVTCHGAANGAVNVTTTGGTGNITYAWNPSASTEDITALSGGTYTLTITDANNCSFTISTVVNEPALLTAVTSHTNVTCNGANDGTVTITVAGGTGPYSYFGNPVPVGTTTFPNLAAGNYVGNVLDINACSAAVSETITEPSVLSITLTPTDASSSTATDGSIVVNTTGGTASYNYVWSNSGDGSNLAPGNYTVTVTDANNCSTTASAIVGFSSGIGNVEMQNIKIYPNPANGQLTIETSSANDKFVFAVYSIDGKLISEKTISGEKVVMDVEQLSVGFYSYQLKNISSGNVSNGKLQIQR